MGIYPGTRSFTVRKRNKTTISSIEYALPEGRNSNRSVCPKHNQYEHWRSDRHDHMSALRDSTGISNCVFNEKERLSTYEKGESMSRVDAMDICRLLSKGSCHTEKGTFTLRCENFMMWRADKNGTNPGFWLHFPTSRLSKDSLILSFPTTQRTRNGGC
jgi:hypothetical protein